MTYAALFSAVGTTYGSGNGSTTFALPNLINKFVEGSSTAGTEKSAGLPNITGTIRIGVKGGSIWDAIDEMSGAFYPSAETTSAKLKAPGYETRTSPGTTKYDASRSNSIYGKSTTVQPPALTMRPFIYTGKTTMNKWQRTA